MVVIFCCFMPPDVWSFVWETVKTCTRGMQQFLLVIALQPSYNCKSITTQKTCKTVRKFGLCNCSGFSSTYTMLNCQRPWRLPLLSSGSFASCFALLCPRLAPQSGGPSSSLQGDGPPTLQEHLSTTPCPLVVSATAAEVWQQLPQTPTSLGQNVPFM